MILSETGEMKMDTPPGNRRMPSGEKLGDGEDLAEVAGVLKALAEPNRLRIFATLAKGDSCNCELKDKLGIRSSLLSHHLRVLGEAKLITSRRDRVDGRWIYYSVNREAAAQLQSWLDAFLKPAPIQERPLCGPEGRHGADRDLLSGMERDS